MDEQVKNSNHKDSSPLSGPHPASPPSPKEKGIGIIYYFGEGQKLFYDYLISVNRIVTVVFPIFST